MAEMNTDPERRYVAYYRVSTGQQRESGLGLEAQRAQVRDYVTANHGRLIGEHSEAVSGRKNNRPELTLALTTCRIMAAVLVIARLDRLSRNVAMIARLIESGVDFVVADFPHANRFTIHVLAAVAEYESRIQSERMKAVFAVLKQRGIKVGNTKRDPARHFPPGCQQASAQARQARAEARRRDLAPLVWKSIAEGKSHRVIASEFNETGVSVTRHSKWKKHAIWRIAKLTAPEFGSTPEVVAARRVGVAQLKVRRLVDRIGPLLLTWRGEGRSYEAIASELRRRGIKSPWGGDWGQASIARYLKRAMAVSALKVASEAAQ
jgi:DNA invertase Pin-like site-specific DNA recombinase